MRMPYFIFNGINSKDYLILNELPPIYKAEKDITKIVVAGRDGFLTQDLGSYKSIVKTIKCTLRDLTQIDYICSWLTGNGTLIISNEADKAYKATIINQIEFTEILRTFHSFIVQFECQPKKYALNNDVVTLESAGSLFNSGTANALPVIKLYGTGNISLTINGNIINLTNVSEYVTIDSDLMDCYKDTVLKNNDMLGEFPELIPGSNSISWTGTVAKVEITPNWRYL